MSPATSNLPDMDFGFLPARYRSPKLLTRNSDGYCELNAKDTRSESQVFIELNPVEQFDNDGLFRLEHYFGNAARLKLDSFVAPTDQGLIANGPGGTGYVLLARPHVDGTTLEELVKQMGTQKGADLWKQCVPATTAKKILWMRSLLKATNESHKLGIMQQDFRFSQIMVEGITPRLICPELRLFTKPEHRENEWSVEFVKSASPELMGLIEHDVNDTSDIYSMGVVFYSLLTGKLPFEGATLSQILSAHLTTQIEGSDTDPLMKVVARMLMKNPHDRYQSVESIIEDLEWIHENEGTPEISGFVAGSNESHDLIGVPLFVGRQRERAQIRNAIDEVRNGDTRFVLVKGESGLGKTRLVRESLNEANKLGMRAFQCEAVEHIGRQAAAPLTQLINNIASSGSAPALAERLDENHEEIHFFFPEFAKAVGLPTPEENRSTTNTQTKFQEDESDGADQFEVNRLSRAICSVLSKLATPHEPAVIWIDDCQWLDSGTVDTLRELARWETESLLVVLSARTSLEQPDPSNIDLKFDTVVETGPLPDAIITELVDSMAIAVPEEAVDTVVRLASGSPFMAEAILREMAETGALIFEDAQWKVDHQRLGEVEASSDTTEALLRRLEYFPPQVQKHLSIAAIIGKSFFASTVSAISGTSGSESRRHLVWARKQRLIWSRPDGSQAFVHDAVRRAIIDQLPEERRKELHIALAEHFEANDGDPIEIAIHFDLAGLHDRAFEPASIAAKRALDDVSLSTALQMYQIAWRGTPSDDAGKRSQISERIGSVLMLAGKYDESDRWFKNAEQEANSKLDRARIVMQRSELAFKRGDKSGAVGLLESAMQLLNIAIPKSWFMIHLFLAWELLVQVMHSLFPAFFLNRKKTATKKDRMVWNMYSRLAHCYWYTRGKAVVLWAHLAGLNRAEKAIPTRELAKSCSEHAPVMALFSWYSRGAKYSARSLRIRRDLNDTWGEGQSRNYFSILLYSTSRFEQCITQARKAEEFLERTGDYWELNIARFQHAAALYRQGNLKEAYELAEKTRRDAIKVGDYQSTGNIVEILARSSLGKIPFKLIETEKDRGLDDRQLQPQLLLAEGVYRLSNDADPSMAVSCFKEAIQIAKETGVSNCYTAPNSAWLATALRKQMRYHRKEGKVSKASFRRHFLAARRAVWLGYRFQNDLPHALRELAYAYADMGDQKRTRKSLMRSLRLAEAQGAQYEAALTRKAFERMDRRFGWREVDDEYLDGFHEVRRIEATVRLGASRETVSIVSRFDALLDAGRKISSALGRRDILKNTVDSAADMLRGQTTLVVLPDEAGGWYAWNSDESFDQEIVQEAVDAKEPIVRDQENLELRTTQTDRCVSVLCCPIVASREVVACIYVSNRLVESMFGPNEIGIVEFIGNAAGSSLEKETSFRELDELNACLEQKVSERTRSLQSRTHELELTAQQLRATQHRLEHAAQAAESANRIKSDFLAKMSHEIRTPITAVLGFTQLILRGVIVEPEEQRKKIKSIESSGKHLLQLVNDLLDISKIEADKIEIEKIECRPLHLLNEIVESLRSKAAENNNQLELDLVPPIPSTIHTDPKRLRQIVTNVVGNAIKFTSNGKITLRVDIEEKEGRCILKLDVIDTGIGMTDEQLKDVFDPFVQADSSITRRFGGTGLGLSISQKLTRALGGDIGVVSRPGEGSTFSITIDVGEYDQLELLGPEDFQNFFERQVSSEWVTADLSSLHILLADDAETNRDLISLVLGDCGANITLAENGQEAVDHALGENGFDVILMDMQMPVLDGYSATRTLRSKGYKGPIYALTANSMKGDREKCLEAGCSDYLTKPIDLNGLVKAMAKLCGSQIASVVASEERTSDLATVVAESKEPIGTSTVSNSLSFAESDLPENNTIRKFTFEFFMKLEKRRPEFEENLVGRDTEQLASLAHWLKGTSGTVMLGTLAEAAKEMESSIHANDWEAVEHIYSLIESYSDAAIEFTNAHA